MQKRFNDLSPLNSYIPKMTRPVYKRRGFYEYDIIKDWPYIVGQKWAELTTPDKLLFRQGTKQNGTLYLRVYSAAAIMIQYIQPEIIERANTYFGYHAISQLKLIQAGFKPAAIKEQYIKEVGTIEIKELGNWQEGELKDALKRLGQAIKAKHLSNDK